METVIYLTREKQSKKGNGYRNVAQVENGKFVWKNSLVAFNTKSGGIAIRKVGAPVQPQV